MTSKAAAAAAGRERTPVAASPAKPNATRGQAGGLVGASPGKSSSGVGGIQMQELKKEM